MGRQVRIDLREAGIAAAGPLTDVRRGSTAAEEGAAQPAGALEHQPSPMTTALNAALSDLQQAGAPSPLTPCAPPPGAGAALIARASVTPRCDAPCCLASVLT